MAVCRGVEDSVRASLAQIWDLSQFVRVFG